MGTNIYFITSLVLLLIFLTIIKLGKNFAADGSTVLKDDDVANPCGFIAKTLFNDTFIPKSFNGKTFTIR